VVTDDFRDQRKPESGSVGLVVMNGSNMCDLDVLRNAGTVVLTLNSSGNATLSWRRDRQPYARPERRASGRFAHCPGHRRPLLAFFTRLRKTWIS
jgi:hypothetical protein